MPLVARPQPPPERRLSGVISRGLLCAACVTMIAVHTHAQTIDPNVVTFLPSISHNAIGPGNVPIVSGYAIEVSALGSPNVVLTIDLGKPSPGADGLIRAPLNGQLARPGLPNSPLEAHVVVRGPGGTSRSSVSNVFQLDGCRVSTTGALQVPGGGGTTSTPLVTAPGCRWTLAPVPTWVSVTSGRSGSGSGQLTFSAGPNPSVSRVDGIGIGSDLVLLFQTPAR